MPPSSPTLTGIDPQATRLAAAVQWPAHPKNLGNDKFSDNQDGTLTGEAKEEQDALDQAIQQSIEDEASRVAREEQASRPNAAQPLPRSLLVTSADLVLSLNNEFTISDDPEGDTVIYIGPPPRMPEQSDKEYRYVVSHFGQVYVVKSSTLKLMGDTSRFTDTDLLGPMSVRSERKLRKLGVLEKAEAKHGGKFKYYIDLRPPREDEEAVILITELSCTKGVLSWYLACDKYELYPLAVQGHDEFGILPRQSQRSSSTADEGHNSKPLTFWPNAASKSPTTDQAMEDEIPPPKLAPEYSPLRHWSAIERLLHAIQGNDPKLDSAPKVWTFFAVARYFGCAEHERVAGWITTWMYTHGNANFIQNNPEVAYRIGMGIRSIDLVKDAFSILVGERALLHVYGESYPSILSPLVRTVHGRKLELLDDDERNRIDHAASSLVQRVRDLFSYLCENLGWLGNCSNYAALERIVGETAEEVESLDSTKILLKEFVRSRICFALSQDQAPCTELEQVLSSTLPFRSCTGESYSKLYTGFTSATKLFTKTFWVALQRTSFHIGPTSTSNQGTVGTDFLSPATPTAREPNRLYYNDPTIRITSVQRLTLARKIIAVNQMLYNRQVAASDAKEKWKTSLPRMLNGSGAESGTARGSPFGAPATGGPTHASESSQTYIPSGPLRKRRKTLESDGTSQAFASGIDAAMASNSATNNMTSREPVSKSPAEVREVPLAKEGGTAIPLRSKDTAKEGGLLHPFIAYAEKRLADEKAAKARVQEKEQDIFYFDSDSDSDLEPPKTLRAAQQENRVPTSPSFVATNTNSAPVGGYHYPLDPELMLQEIGRKIGQMCSALIYPPHLFHETGLLPTNLHDNLLCLTAKEFRFLPLWVPDGNDDGSGGVFDDRPVPNLDATSARYEPFRAGKIRTGYQRHQHRQQHEADSELDSSSSVEDMASQAISTVGKASKVATDGTETVKSLASTNVGDEAMAGMVLVDDPRVDDVDMADDHDHDHHDDTDADYDTNTDAEDDTDTVNVDDDDSAFEMI